MSAWKRLLIATTVVLSGLLVLPFVALPSQAFSWQLFTGLYGDSPALGVNYTTGAPGSYFRFEGYNFPAVQPVTISVNGRDLGELTTDENGRVSFILATQGASEGLYDVTASSFDAGEPATATVRFELRAGEPVRAQEGTGVIFFVPAGFAQAPSVYLPIVRQ